MPAAAIGPLEGWGVCPAHLAELDRIVPGGVVDRIGLEAAIMAWPGRLGQLPRGIGVCVVCAQGADAPAVVARVATWLAGIRDREAGRLAPPT